MNDCSEGKLDPKFSVMSAALLRNETSQEYNAADGRGSVCDFVLSYLYEKETIEGLERYTWNKPCEGLKPSQGRGDLNAYNP